MHKEERKGKNMTPKELLYIEDSLGHDVELKAVCKDAMQKLEDNNLKAFVGEIMQGHAQCFNRFYGLLR